MNLGPRQPFGKQLFDAQATCTHYFNNMMDDLVGKRDQYAALNSYQMVYPKIFQNITPKTYLMPENQRNLAQDFDVNMFYIGKQNSGSCGRHTIISNSLFEITSVEPDVVQEYD